MKNIYMPLLALIAIIGITSLSNCNPNRDADCPQKTTYKTVNLSADMHSKVPYTGYDTLYFVNQQGDTCIVKGTGKQYYYETVDDNIRPDCPFPASGTNYQAYNIEFKALKGNIEFILEMHSSLSYGQVIEIKILKLDRKFRIGTLSIDVIPDWKDEYFIDTLQINNLKFYKVRKLISNSTLYPYSRDTTSYLFYNSSKGIIKIVNGSENQYYVTLN